MTDPVRPTLGFRIREIVLRSCQVDVPTHAIVEKSREESAHQAIEISLNVNVEELDSTEELENFGVSLTVIVTGSVTGVESNWNVRSTYYGRFEHHTDAEISGDSARTVHAPAYLYGFAREHVADLSRRCGFHVVLPPVRMAPPTQDQTESRKT